MKDVNWVEEIWYDCCRLHYVIYCDILRTSGFVVQHVAVACFGLRLAGASIFYASTMDI